MKLTDLEPRWCREFNAPPHARQGLTFLCPCCRTTRLGAWFDVPLCGLRPIDLAAWQKTRNCDHREHQPEHADTHFGGKLWHVTGDSFDNLTLTPSIDASESGHWHGYITIGQIT